MVFNICKALAKQNIKASDDINKQNFIKSLKEILRWPNIYIME